MNILQASKTPLAGVCELMCRTINEYFPGVHQSKVLNKGPGKHAWYVRKPKALVPTWSVKDKKQVNEALEWADVIHCHANVSARSLGRLDLLKKKVWVYQWHGAQIWPFPCVWEKNDYKHVRFIHIGQGWVERQMDFFGEFIEKWGMKVMPNVITAHDPLHSVAPWDGRKNKVSFAPSQLRDEAVNRKGVKVTRANMRGYQCDLIASTTFEDCLKRKRKSKLGIDELVTPMYHRSGLEYLSQGTPCLCSYSADAERILKDATGADRMPFIQCKPETLQARLQHYFKDISDEERQAMGQEARGWIDEYYHPRKLIGRYIDEVYTR